MRFLECIHGAWNNRKGYGPYYQVMQVFHRANRILHIYKLACVNRIITFDNSWPTFLFSYFHTKVNLYMFTNFSLKFFVCYVEMHVKFCSYLILFLLSSVSYILRLSHKPNVRLHAAINRTDFVSWCMLYWYQIRTKVTKLHYWENDAELSWVNH